MTTSDQAYEANARLRARRTITWFLLFAICMFFAALLSAYVVSKGSTDYWVHFNIPRVFWYSTAAIVVSSITAQLALMAADKGNRSSVSGMLLATLVLGLVFTWTQFRGWNELFQEGFALVSRLKSIEGTYGTDYTITRLGEPLVKEGSDFFLASDVQRARPLNAEMDEFKNTASSYFYVLTYSHWAHVFGGLLALVVMLVQAARAKYTPQDHVGLWAGVMYWHFLAGLWVLILSFLTIVH